MIGMNKKTTARMPRSLVIVFKMVLSAFAISVNRLIYIRYLVKDGYRLGDIVVPWGTWWSYQSTGVGLLMNSIAIGPWVLLALLTFGNIMRNKRRT